MSAPLLLLLFLAQQSGADPQSATARNPAEAVIQLQKAIQANPRAESNYTDLGNVLLSTQNFQEAALVLEATRKRFPQSAQAALSLGVAYYGLRRFPEAVAAFLEAGKLNPSAEQPITFLNRTAEHWGDRKPDVVALFTAYAEKNPRSALAQFALGRATGDIEKVKLATQLAPSVPDGFIEMGGLLEAQRDFPGAIAAFRRAAALNPKDPVPHYRLSRLYARTGDSAKAEAERALHEKLSAGQKAELDRRQEQTKHLKVKVRQQ